MMDMPILYPVKQNLHKTAILDLEPYFRGVLAGMNLPPEPAAGTKVGICVGSRGISHISLLVRLLVDYLKNRRYAVLIIPCMGSHGGATAEGQRLLLAEYGIADQEMGAGIVSRMDVVDLGPSEHGYKVYCDAVAASCDLLIAVNRVKEHTDFFGATESGILKMLAVGLGNHLGAAYIHGFGARGLIEGIPDIAARIIDRKKVIGIGIVEDGYAQIDRIDIMSGSAIFAAEKELLIYARQRKAKIPFPKLDYLVIEEMGKNISGAGMDTKVIGRVRFHGVAEPVSPAPDIIACLRLTPESHGNAAGVGLVDLISKRLHDTIDFQTTFTNGITAKCPERYKTPMFLANDRETILTGLEFAQATGGFRNRIALIKNTGDLELLYVSLPLRDEAADIGTLDVLSTAGARLTFNDAGDYQSPFPA